MRDFHCSFQSCRLVNLRVFFEETWLVSTVASFSQYFSKGILNFFVEDDKKHHRWKSLSRLILASVCYFNCYLFDSFRNYLFTCLFLKFFIIQCLISHVSYFKLLKRAKIGLVHDVKLLIFHVELHFSLLV